MPTYTVFPIQRPTGISSSHLAAYKTLRLTSLQVDPQAFGSNYARELAFTDDVWRQRIDSPCKRTFVASVSESVRDAESGGDTDVEDVGRVTLHHPSEDKGEWIGTASIVGPSDLVPGIVDRFREDGVLGSNWQVYGLFAMWVHPAHRKRGIGAQLVKACLEWARTHIASKAEGGGDIEKVVVLLVHDNNVAGRALYSRLGFNNLEGVSVEEGERWMLTKV
ncbi:hypothetical protein JVU11DRAFT_3632 [Chiua virens]|nr:hypothetical protein JVU11DRAFT_3632 [Chiua virens]